MPDGELKIDPASAGLFFSLSSDEIREMKKKSHFLALFEKAQREKIPLEVSIELTHHCNFRCRHCYIPDFKVPDRLSTERILELLDELVEMGTLYLTFTGGEVFLRRDWREIFRAARRKGFQITVLSNGSLIDEAIADELAGLHSIVEISYYAAEASNFEAITGRDGSFETTTRAIRLLRERGIELQLKMPVMRINSGSVQGVRGFAEELGVDFQSFAKLLPMKDGGGKPLEERMSRAELLSYVSGPHSACFLPGEADVHPPAQGGPLCAAAHRFAAISSNGDVLACNIMPGVAGNILKESFREIWEASEWLKELRRLTRDDLRVCNTCEYFSYCGRCPAQALLEDGDLRGPSRDSCEYAEALKEVGKTP